MLCHEKSCHVAVFSVGWLGGGGVHPVPALVAGARAGLPRRGAAGGRGIPAAGPATSPATTTPTTAAGGATAVRSSATATTTPTPPAETFGARCQSSKFNQIRIWIKFS